MIAVKTVPVRIFFDPPVKTDATLVSVDQLVEDFAAINFTLGKSWQDLVTEVPTPIVVNAITRHTGKYEGTEKFFKAAIVHCQIPLQPRELVPLEVPEYLHTMRSDDRKAVAAKRLAYHKRTSKKWGKRFVKTVLVPKTVPVAVMANRELLVALNKLFATDGTAPIGIHVSKHPDLSILAYDPIRLKED